MTFSIIVPTYNDPTLKECLESLARLSYPKDQYEVIIVDNRSDAWVKTLVARYPFRYVREETPGSYAARNRGIAVATGKCITFTDADCTVASDWLQQLEAAFRSGADGVLGFSKGKNTNKIAEYEQRMYEANIARFTHKKNLTRLDTRNCAITRATLDRIGCFSPQLQFGGDWEYGSRMHAAGLRIHYAPDAIVTHTNPTQLRTLLQKRIRQNAGTMRVRELHDAQFLLTYFPQLAALQPSTMNQARWAWYRFLWCCALSFSDLFCAALPRRAGYALFKMYTVLAIRIGRLQYICTSL